MRVEGADRVRTALAGLAHGARVLDIGGGTGAHSEVMRTEGFVPVLVDPSAAQRAKAHGRRLQVVGGVSQRLPFSDHSFDMAYFHLSLHYGDWLDAVTEAVRVVRPGGKVWIWTFTRNYLETSFTGRWFPSVREHDVRRFPDVAVVADHFASSGMERVALGGIVERVERTVAEWEEAFRARFVSTLQLIEDDELEEGVKVFRSAHPDGAEPVVAGLEFVSISAWVPG
ncbi:MAG: class I SAM-dependent methyltransferase [Acidimicrobiia bacterium]|nr:class I SAM-dependent methyltransferase [Acidimicrobiia bacterium]